MEVWPQIWFEGLRVRARWDEVARVDTPWFRYKLEHPHSVLHLNQYRNDPFVKRVGPKLDLFVFNPA